MTEKHCWYCHHFIPDDPETLNSGICTRHAPKGADYQSKYLAQQTCFKLDMGHLLAAGTIQSDVALPLHALGNADTLAASCHQLDTTGLHANDIMPFALPTFYTLNVVSVHLSASLLNCGASAVADTVYLNIHQIQVTGDAQTQLNKISIPIPAASVSVHGNTTDLFYDGGAKILETPVSLSPYLSGFRAALDTTESDEIAEVRNLKIGLLIMGTQTSDTPTAETSKSKYAAIENGRIDWCGEYRPNITE